MCYEAGDYSYEDSSPGEPFGGRQLESLFGVGQFRTHIDYRLGKRLGFSYDWELTRYTQTQKLPGYPGRAPTDGEVIPSKHSNICGGFSLLFNPSTLHRRAVARIPPYNKQP